MNDKDRDRDGDGAGPVAPYRRQSNKPTTSGGLRAGLAGLLLLAAMLYATPQRICAQTVGSVHLRGLSLTVDAGTLIAGNSQANFYNGDEGNVNSLYRILHSETYGTRIWNELTEQDLISSAIGNYNQLTVAEYGDMRYKIAFELGVGLRYDFEGHGWAWMARFDYSKLNAVGQVLLNSGHSNAYVLTNQGAYVVCPTAGVEKRIFVDLGVVRKFRLDNGLDLELAAGGNVNNTEVVKSEIMIAGSTYSILDVWQGQSPSSYTTAYEYQNQGGMGWGGFAMLQMGITLPSYTALTLGYTFRYTKINLDGYEDFAPHHLVALSVALNNFSFFDD